MAGGYGEVWDLRGAPAENAGACHLAAWRGVGCDVDRRGVRREGLAGQRVLDEGERPLNRIANPAPVASAPGAQDSCETSFECTRADG